VPDVVPAAGEPRPPTEVLDRLLAHHCVVSVALGLDADAARRLVDGYGVADALRHDEVEYLADVADGIRVEDASRALGVEAVTVLAWALELGPEPPLDDVAAPWVVSVPDVPSLRELDELRRMHELHVAMLWALRDDPDLDVGAAPGPVDPYVVRERAAALAWLFA
jgi:hypothetical protein